MAYDPIEGLLNGANLITGLIDHGQKTQDYVSGMFDQRAKLDAGAAVANGDLEGAAGILASRGDIEGAQALRAKAATTKSLKAYAGGDFPGAKQAAADAGDAPLLGAITTDAEKEKADRAAWLSHAADALLQIKDPARREAAFKSSIAPTMKLMGMTDEQLAAIDGQSLTDEGLNAFKAAMGQASKITIHQDPNSGELLGVDPTGKVTVLHPGARKPDWKPIKRADGSVERYVDVNDPANQTGADAAPPEPKGAVYDQIASAASSAGASPQEISYLKRLGHVESSGNPKAQNGSSTGVFQFHPDTFAKAGGGDINDVGDQTKAALSISRQDRQALAAAGVQPSDANVYIMHQQGAAGGRALLQAPPDVGAVAALAPAYGGDETRATAAIAGNIGLPFKTAADKAAARAAAQHMTAGEFVDLWRKRWNGVAQAGGKSVPGDAPQADDGNLSDDAVEQAAERYIVNGALPPMGMGKTGTQNRDKILNKAAEMEKATGRTGAEAVAAWAGVKANVATLTDLTKRRGNIKAFEDNAVANADLALSLAPKGAAPLNVPVINKWIQTGRKAVAGDPNVTQFDIALGTFLDEYAKITSGSISNQGTTDASRKEAYSRLSKYATQGQLAAGIATMKQEMGNRLAGLDKEIASTQAAISNGGKAAPAPAAVVAPRPEGWSKQLAPKQLSAAKRYLGSAAPGGSQANPFVPNTQAEFDHIASGQWFINPADGKSMKKK